MGEVLGLGVTHGPFIIYPPEELPIIWPRSLTRPWVPEELKDPANWPDQVRAEWGDDEGLQAALTHHSRLMEGFRKARAALDAFNPDVVIIWGDDQYENFHDDVVPAFCVYAEEEYQITPFNQRNHLNTTRNIYNESPDWVLRTKGHRQAGKELATHLLRNNFDVAYAYKQLHHQYGHAFWRTVMHLDVDRQGFPYPIVPFHVNCYGSNFVRNKGESPVNRQPGAEPDPPGPSPKRCFDLGAEVARFAQQSPYRVALVGSSSWSHAFLVEKHHYLWPDVEADRARYEELSAGDYRAWRGLSTEQIEDAGQQELLNWVCLAGALDELGLKPDYAEFVETWIFNSPKTMAIFK